MEKAHPRDAERQSNEGGIAVLAEHRRAAAYPVAIHEPDLGFVRGTVVPEDVGFAIPVKVAHPNDAERQSDKGGIAILTEHRRAAAYPVAIHEPDLGFDRGTVVPEDVGFAIPVNVAHP